MSYLVYDENGELVDIFEFTPEQLKSYKEANPLYMIESAKHMDQHFLIEEFEESIDLDDED